MRAAITLPVLLCAAALTGCGDAEGPAVPEPARESGTAHHFDLERIADGFTRPTFVGAAPGDDALWVAEQAGRVLRLAGGGRTTVLDLSPMVTVGAEQGLLGLAFHPDFAEGRPLLYVHYSDARGDTRVAEYRVRDGRADPRPERVLLAVDQPEENHNGGHLAFGPDGRLYLGFGDGGGAFDPRGVAQDEDSRFGKLLAADVGQRRPRWDVVLYGLRNPWRFWFDFALNEVWIGDVGQDKVEEVDRVLLEADEPPKNLGWSAYEGDRKVADRDLDGDGELVFPVATYSHEDGCSVTGGVVYGGRDLPSLYRRYIFGDFCSGALWTVEGTPAGAAEDFRRERATLPQVTHIGVDARGELVLASGDGGLYRATAASP